jgi:uridylate kinase
MAVVVSIGGSVLDPGSPGSVEDYAAAIEELAAETTVGCVVGGGRVARDYIETARACDANEMELDALGIAATRLNARLLATAVGGGTVRPPTTYEDAAEAVERGAVPVMGGVQPGQTTDAVAAALAEFLDADRLVLATSVPGVFDADPNASPDAERFDRLTPAELVARMADLSVDAGSSAPVDLLAAKLIERAGLPTVVVDGTDPDRVVAAARGEAVDGTTIDPVDG